LVPSSASARQELQGIIHEELDRGIYKPEGKKFVLEQMEELRKRGAQGVVLACTEFPLITKQRDFALPYLTPHASIRRWPWTSFSVSRASPTFEPTSNSGLGLGRLAQCKVHGNASQKVLRRLWTSGR